jgi:p-cumate 2,3-dioxygenase subunit beta
MSDAALKLVSQRTVNRISVEDFLFAEARLLDRWMLKEWQALFTPDAHYLVAPAGADDDADPAKVLFYINDNQLLLKERLLRLYKRTAHAEFPHSRTRRLVSNVQILGGTDESLEVVANYILYRTKFGHTEIYPGHLLYQLCVRDGALMIQKKTAFIDTDDLYEQAKVSIIL